MRQTDAINGQEFREMLTTATAWLEKNSAEIDALNVFPVPDGDCGTNMLLTMRSAIEEADAASDISVSGVTAAMAKGALMGARGNSGVILSQIWRGIAESMAGKNVITGKDLADALANASVTAREAVSNPAEGTILTVSRDAGKAAQAQADKKNNDLVTILEVAVEAAAESVARTPSLLPALREAGVVDAGGQGYHTLLDGALRYMRGEAETMQFRKPQLIASSVPMPARGGQFVDREEAFGYCTEFMIKGTKLSPAKLKTKLVKKGQSLIVVGDKETIRVHIHTLDPGEIIHFGSSVGTLHQVSIRNMDEQHEAYLEMQRERMPQVNIATVAVVPGDGLTDIFNSLGVTAIVAGGQTMNPSTKELLRAVESVASDKVLVLPNNKNIIPVATQIQSLTKKKVEVLLTETIPQGVAALLAFDYEADFETNAQRMELARNAVKSVEIARAVRSAKLGGVKIKKNQFMGFLDGNLEAVTNDAASALDRVLEKVDLAKSQVVTIYRGADVEEAEATQVSDELRKRYENLQIETVRGGQPHYNYIVSIE